MAICGGGQKGFRPDAGEVRLIWMTDSHIFATAHEPQDSGMLAALADATTWQADAVVHTGDIGNNDIAAVRRGFALLRSVTLPCPLILAIGNHDEYEIANDGVPNTAQIEASDCFNMAAPFYTTGTFSTKNGTLRVRWFALDCNFYDHDPNTVVPNSPFHAPGDRVGYTATEPSGGYYRRFGPTQRAWVTSTLAADTTSNMALLFVHYPPNGTAPTDGKLLADVLQADGRGAILLYGHAHAHANLNSITTTDGRKTFTFYKAPAMQESGCYVRMRVRVSGQFVSVKEVSVKNYTDPAGLGWVINAPFQVVP